MGFEVDEHCESLKEFIVKLDFLFSHDNLNKDYVQAWVSAWKPKLSELKPYMHGDIHRYTRNLVHKGNDNYNLILMIWPPSTGSAIHDHANAHCFAKIIEGELQETLYDWPDEGKNYPTNDEDAENQALMEPREIIQYRKNQCAYICDEIGLHRIENKSHSDRAMSLHIYSPPFQQCATFEERSGKKHTCKMIFWSEYGNRTPFRPDAQKAEDN